LARNLSIKELVVVNFRKRYFVQTPNAIHNRCSVTQAGVTLIELLITVAIVGILAAVAYPSYQNHVLRASRADAEGVLMEAAQFLERNYTTNNCYHRSDSACGTARASNNCVGATGEVSLAGLCVAPKIGTTRYNISFSSILSQSYTLQAVPTGTDAVCGTLTLTNTGVKGESGTGTAAECWSQ
jgi:type IV pilus assembly protein PilE